MANYLVNGGFGSSREQCAYFAAQISESTGAPADGAHFSWAISNPEAHAERIDNREVISYSAGVYATHRTLEKYDVKPRSLTMIAPPLPERVRSLVLRGALIGLDDPAQHEIEEKIACEHDIVRELREHPVRNFGAVAKLGHFAALDFAREMAESGIPVRVGFMERDGLFNLEAIDVDTLQRAQASGVDVHLLKGTHTRFSKEPLRLLNELDSAPVLAAPQHSLDEQLSLKRAVSKQFGSVTARLASLPRAA